MSRSTRFGGWAGLCLLALAGAGPAQGQAQGQVPSAEVLSRLLGPLASQGVVGRAGDWTMALADDAYVLANPGAPYGARFVSIPAPAGPLSLAAEVRSEPGNAAADALVGAGLLFDVQGAGAARRFALVLVERSGEIGLFRSDAKGLNRVETRKLPGATGFVRLAVAEEAGQIVITANGIRVAGAPVAPTAGTRVGIAAVGPGRFAFRGVRLGIEPDAAAAAPQRFGRVEARLPAAWSASLSDAGTWSARGPGGAHVAWWPFRRSGTLDDDGRAALLEQLVRAETPDLRPGPVERRAGAVTAPLVRDGLPAGRAVLHAAPGPDGATVGLFALATAGRWDGARATEAAALLAAPRLVGPPPAIRPAAARTYRWADPAGGFSAELPQGWTVTGGTQPGRDDSPTWIVNLTAPDGATRVFLGDPELPLFLLPTERLKAAGVEEGAAFRHGDGTPVLVARLMPGLGFAEVHAMRLLAGRCTDEPKAEYRRRRLDLAPALALALLPAPPGGELESGEVAMSCTGKEGPIAAYVLAGTDGNPRGSRGTGAWSAPVVLGFVAPRDAVPAALGALGTLVASIAPTSTALLGRTEDAGARSEAAAQVSAAVSGSWWASHGPRIPEPKPIATLPGDPARPVEGDRLQRWFPEGPGPGAGLDWRALLAP